MIISRTPLRISFFGGGSDYPEYFKRKPGKVISLTIDKYIYISIKEVNISDYNYKIFYTKNEFCNEIEEIEHPVIKACLNRYNITKIEIHVFSDLPSKSGTGSSSSFTVGLLNAINTYNGVSLSKEELAKEAIFIEREILKERVGVQDQLAAAYGGFNIFNFNKDAFLRVNLTNQNSLELFDYLLLFYTGDTRFAHTILKEQIEKTKTENLDDSIELLVKMVDQGHKLLQERNFKAFGELMNKGWEIKKSLSSAISNQNIDNMYKLGLSAGAFGGKLLGAGSGGFLLLVADPSRHNKIRRALSVYKEVDFGFDALGSQIIYSS